MNEEEDRAIEWLKMNNVWCANHIEDVKNYDKHSDKKSIKEEIRLTQIEIENGLNILNLIERLQHEIKLKDKTIDLMASSINSYDNQLIINMFKDKEEVKEYFINKIKKIEELQNENIEKDLEIYRT